MDAPEWVVQHPHSAREPGATNRTHGISIQGRFVLGAASPHPSLTRKPQRTPDCAKPARAGARMLEYTLRGFTAGAAPLAPPATAQPHRR